MKKLILPLLTLVLLVACAQPLTPETALERLRALPEYQTMFFAPFHIGRVVLTSENHVGADKYISEKYGKLIADGLLTVEKKDKNAWRTVLQVSLTEAGMALCDPRRTDEEHAFVAVCRVAPMAVDTLMPVGEDSVMCKYQIQQREVTPFGLFLGFEEGKTFKTKITLPRK